MCVIPAPSCAAFHRFPDVLLASVTSLWGTVRAGEVLSAFSGERICLGVWMQGRHRLQTTNYRLQTAQTLAQSTLQTFNPHKTPGLYPSTHISNPPDALLSLHSSPPRTIPTPSQPPFSRTWPYPAHRHYSSASLSPDMCRRRGSGSAGKTRHRGPVHAGVGLLRPSLSVEMIPQIR